ncbi:MAG: transporter substrate-binding protein [Deltaproteobacteria bacterium]|jgi:ABC-type nitrate/sulfonate/bicarbonate transport system substrate-binding protein|nr:transporter substrate-binding protein [Deltaproteobacteria bacterium]
MSDHLIVNVFNVDAGLIVARAKGIFATAGLEVDVMVTPNSTDQMRGLSLGSWQIVSTAFDNVLGWSGREGAEIVAIAQVAQGITLPVYVRPEIKSWEDLRGKPLAVDAVDTAYALVLRRILLAHGLEIERGDYTLLPKGATGHRLESMNQGESFAGVLNPPWDAKADAAGMKRFADQREILPNYPGGVFAVNRKWANDNRAILTKYLAAWDQGLRWAQDVKNRDEAIKLIAEAEKIDEKNAANRLRQLPSNGRLDLAGLQTVLDLRVQFGLTPPMGNELPKYYDESFYNQTSK